MHREVSSASRQRCGGGHDILDGGPGRDGLYGMAGNDTYIFNRGDEVDLLADGDSLLSGEIDTLRLGEGISAAEMTIWNKIAAMSHSVGELPEDNDSIPGNHFSDTILGFGPVTISDNLPWRLAA